MSLPVAILAGGLARRLGAVAASTPKALVTVAGRPFIEHQLELLRSQGYAEVVVCAGYLGEMIEHHLGDGARWGMKIGFSFDGPQPLGTGGALRHALPRLGDAFLVLYGDSYLTCDFRRVERAFLSSGMSAQMTVFRNEGRWDTSNVAFRDGRVLAHDKRRPTPDMQHIDYGLGALRAAALERFAAGAAFDLSELYGALIADGRMAGLEVQERFYEIGSPAGLAETGRYLAAHPSKEPAA